MLEERKSPYPDSGKGIYSKKKTIDQGFLNQNQLSNSVKRFVTDDDQPNTIPSLRINEPVQQVRSVVSPHFSDIDFSIRRG